MRIACLLALAACNHASSMTPDASSGDAPASTPDSPADAPQPPPARIAGINFPPTQGTTNAGAFLPGVYNYGYTDAQIAAANATFTAMRLPINVESANDPVTLAKLRSYVDQFAGQAAIIAMFDTTTDPTGQPHADGLPDIASFGSAWAKVHAAFATYPNVRYELFSEPFGYSAATAAQYLADMQQIIIAADLPAARVILDGVGYADDVAAVANVGWTGDLAYHFYPNWLSSNRTQSNYSNFIQGKLAGLSSRVWITEFGANLSIQGNTCYETYIDGMPSPSADVDALRGLDDALRAFRAANAPIKGAFFWHGWHNGDSYDYWDGTNAEGACKVRLIHANY
ncbi:MAG: hypothetical protein HOV81_05185 [Kofleriaceae bacterium]|nr:hypothetical protein [Kofleriaceae bacterium]